MTPHSEDTAESARILVVDDEATLRNALGQYLGHRGFDVHQAESGEAALERLRDGGFSLMLLDMHMPGMTGPDVVPEALDIDPDLAILMVTAAGDATTAAICMQRGAVDYLTKPIELNDLGGAIDRALIRRDTVLQERGITDWLKQEVVRQTEEIRHEQQKHERLTVATLEALINALEAKNEFLSGHSARVAAYSAGVATELELSDDEIETIRVAGRLHDLGKIGIREAILDKKGPLTPEEYAHVKQHVVIGAEILAPLDHLGPIVGYVKHHHEHWDGNGYPDGFAGEDIPLGARIICAAEIYDALTTSRPYQDRLEPDDAIERMRVLSGSVVDPTVMEAFANSVVHHRQLVFLEDENERRDRQYQERRRPRRDVVSDSAAAPRRNTSFVLAPARPSPLGWIRISERDAVRLTPRRAGPGRARNTESDTPSKTATKESAANRRRTRVPRTIAECRAEW